MSRVDSLRSRRWLLAGTVLSSAALILGVATASATTTLRGGPAPLPSYATTDHQDDLVSLSCGAPGNCAAVGTVSVTGGTQALLESERNSVWTSIALTMPSGAETIQPFNFMRSVSCASAGNCVAVGEYQRSDHSVQLLMYEEKNFVWANVLPPMPSDASSSFYNFFYDVHCVSAGNCVAVGTYSVTGGSHFLIETETAGIWTASTAQIPSDALSTASQVLRSVSCSSVGHCVAVGDYGVAGTLSPRLPVIEKDVLGTWTAVVAPLPANHAIKPLDGLSTVSCPSDGNCIAGGFYQPSPETSYPVSTLTVEEINGTWSAPTIPAPSDVKAGLNNTVNITSCSSAGNCVLAGVYSYNGGGFSTKNFVAVERAHVWSLASIPAMANVGDQLTAIDCASDTVCTAVGDLGSNGAGALATFNGTTWSVTIPEVPSGEQYMYPKAISCPTVNGCTVAGHYWPVVGHHEVPFLATTSMETAPGAPTITKVVDESGGFQVKFTAPSYDGGVLVTTYQVSVDGGKNWATRHSGTTASPIVVMNLKHHKAYNIRIRAVNAIGHGASSGQVTSTTK